MQFVTVPAGIGEVGRHNPPERLFGIVLSGFMEIETSDGAVYRLKPGRVVLVEDTHGKGHITRCPDGVTVAFIAAPVEVALDVRGWAR
jgi:quercetin dioxygenase-like cupin family protein